MLLRKIVLPFGLVWLIQFKGSAQTWDSVNKALVLERVIYHAGPCNGICPTIDMIIDSNRDVYVRRRLWTAKGEPDKAHSGNFKGKIDRHTYFNLFAELASSHYAGLQFPVDFCCDASIKTIIVYANGKRTKLSSMTPPKDALKMIAFLQDLALRLQLPPTTEDWEIEQ